MVSPQSPALSWIEADASHAEAIAALHNGHVLDRSLCPPPMAEPAIAPMGFLLAPTTSAEIQAQQAQGTRFVVAWHPEDGVVGFVSLAQPQITQDFLDQLTWSDRACQARILSPQHVYIKTLATDPRYAGQGIGRLLYGAIAQCYPTAVFSAFIVISPVCNLRSRIFHEKQGFRPVGQFQQERFLDLDHYISLLMLKDTPSASPEW